MKLSETSLNKTRKIRPIDKSVIEGEELEVEEDDSSSEDDY